MKFNLLVATSQLSSKSGKLLGTGTLSAITDLARQMVDCGIQGDIYDLPNGSRDPDEASPFSLNNGFAQNIDELNIFDIPELAHNPSLRRQVEKLTQNYQKNFGRDRTVSYILKRTLMPWILEECYSEFRSSVSSNREENYQRFLEISCYWLNEYALYEVYKEESIDFQNSAYSQIDHKLVQGFIKKNQERMSYHKYCQFLYFEQREQLRKELKKLNTHIVTNLPFSVEFESADVFFHSEVFDTNFQVGCPPEPEHGYPEQAWGIAVYRERKDELRKYLEEKMNWLSLMGDGVFLDHLVGWCGQYVMPTIIPKESCYPHGHFLTKVREEREENMKWFMEIILNTNLQIKGEIAGDFERVKATRAVVDRMVEAGHEISAMAIPRWETIELTPIPLKEYGKSALIMVETHDTSTLLQYLLNEKGNTEDFESPEIIREVCTKVLGLPFFLCDIPLSLKDVDHEVWVDICRRSVEGVPSENVIFTLPGLISLIEKKYRTSTIKNNINNKPGTSGAVGNEWRNWSYFSPPVETLTESTELKKFIRQYGKRSYKPFDHFHYWQVDNSDIQAIYSKVGNRKIIYRDSQKKWVTLGAEANIDLGNVLIELLFYNHSEAEAWDHVDPQKIIPINDGEYQFIDLNANLLCYSYQGSYLREHYLFIKLAPQQIHHFIVIKV